MAKFHTIEIKRKHIKNGQPEDPWQCAIARATRNHFDATRVTVAGEISIEGAAGQISDLKLKLTKRAFKFIDKFDNREKVQPTKMRFAEIG
jgi:hypothetical protein